MRLGGPGSKRYGIIDCFCGRPPVHPLAEYLDTNPVDTIEFVVLTHPHDDHFLGIQRILTSHGQKIKHFYDCGVDPRHVAVKSCLADSDDNRRAFKELEAIREFRRKRSMKGRVFSISNPDVVIFRDATLDVEISSVAPPGDSAGRVEQALTQYYSRLIRALKKSGSNEQYERPVPASTMDLNLLSSAFLVRVGGSRMLIGGDVLRSSWNTLLGSGMRIDSEVVLLSHHGSYTGFPKKWWGNGFGASKALALVSGEGRHQPSPSVVQHLSLHGAQIISTSMLIDPCPGVDRIGTYVSRFHHKNQRRQLAKQDIVLSIDRDGIRWSTLPSAS